MNGESESTDLDKICEEVKRAGKITGEHLTRLAMIFGSRFQKAWEAVRDNRVKKYIFKPSGRVMWIVVGRERDYIVMPDAGFCSKIRQAFSALPVLYPFLCYLFRLK
ncbi:MAG: hypothetical protein QXR59_00140 [Candidatus Bathyarchaeia archaeon]